VSLIGHKPGKAVFVGVYSRGEATPLNREEYWRVPANIELKRLGMGGFKKSDPRRSILWFDLEMTDVYPKWKGKLVVDWPPPERVWWRWADRNVMPVAAILEDSALVADMPTWDQMVLNREELAVLPTRWRAALSEWRGIYYIFDASDGKGYVGSAYGSANILGRWLNYALSGHGGDKLLRKRDPKCFRFSILQRVSPDMDVNDVIRLEGTWKERLHTRQPHGLNDN
jgi:hypothetical protein